MVIIETRWRFNEPLACKRELIGASFNCKIGIYTAEIKFPILKFNEASNHNYSVRNELTEPIGTNNEIYETHLHQWGLVKDSSGNCCINTCVLWLYIESIENYERNKNVIKKEIRDWFSRFYLNCNYLYPNYSLNSPDNNPVDIKHEIVFWEKRGGRFYDIGSREMSLSIIIHRNANYLSLFAIKKSLKATCKNRLPFFARRVFYNAVFEHRQGQFRTSILYSATSCEVALTYILKQNGVENIKNLRQKFIKVNQLKTDVLNNFSYDYFINNRNNCIHEGFEISRDDSLNGLLIAKRLLEECPMWDKHYLI